MKLRNYKRTTSPKLFDDFWGSSLSNFFDASFFGESHPSLNIKETDEAYTLEVAVPGMPKDAFDINVENGLLRLKAEQKHEDNQEDDTYVRREFSYQSFERTFQLPDDVDSEAINASYIDGVLHIELPRVAEKAKPHKVIEIK